MGKLYLTEKPSVAELLANTLGKAQKQQTHWTIDNGDTVTWAIGHLVSLANPDEYDPKWRSWNLANLPVMPAKFKWRASDANAAKRLDEIEDVIAAVKPTSIVNACDAGREGELIFWLIWAELKLEGKYPMERLWLRSMTKEGIGRAMADIKPGANTRNLAVAAASRSMADWIIGMNATRAASKVLATGPKEIWSVGRVQTPTLALLVDRNQERADFKPQDVWGVSAVFSADNKTFPVNATLPTQADAERVAAACASPGKITDVVTTEDRPPNKLFDLTTLQRFMNITAGWPAQRTLDAAQKLYEHEKVITYPRTDSDALPADYEKEAQRVLDTLPAQGFGTIAALALPADKCPHKTLVFDDKGVTDHFAIIPTGTPLSSKMSDHATLYATIVKRFVAAFCPPEKVEVKVRTVELPSGDKLTSTQETTVDPGWKAVYGRAPGAVKGPNLPGQSGDTATPQSATPTHSMTPPPPLHNEASLLEQMTKDKNKSLGTAATRASIIENLKFKQYIRASDGNWEPTEKGTKLVQALRDRGMSDITNSEMTGAWEQRLRNIEAGTEKAPAFNAEIKQLTGDMVDKFKEPAQAPAAPANSIS